MTEPVSPPANQPRRAAVPAFQPPRPPQPPAALMEPTQEIPTAGLIPSQRPAPDASPKMSLFDRARHSGRIRTDTSSVDGPTDNVDKPRAAPDKFPLDKEVAVEAAGAVAGLLVLAGVLVVKWRYRGARKLRQPTDQQIDGVARPAANMLMRRAGLGRYGVDLLQGLAALATVGAYLNDGPLTHPADLDTYAIPTAPEA